MGYKDSQFYSSINDYYWKNVLLPAVIICLVKQMKVIHDIASLKTLIDHLAHTDNSIGIVPTMGAIHQGHESLLKAANEQNDISVVSIFVNPLQFDNAHDLTNYPTTITTDLKKLSASNCDIVFMPSTNEMYPEAPTLRLNFGVLETEMEGVQRPGHFNGVGLVVLKLLNLVRPTRAYFGQKDLQQFKIIEVLVNDTSLPVELKMLPIIREDSGLAMSSRNKLLSNTFRETASQIYRALMLGSEVILLGGSIEDATKGSKDHLHKFPEISIEYLKMVSLKNLQEVRFVSEDDQLVLCFAGYLGNIRLIDNIIIKQA